MNWTEMKAVHVDSMHAGFDYIVKYFVAKDKHISSLFYCHFSYLDSNPQAPETDS